MKSLFAGESAVVWFAVIASMFMLVGGCASDDHNEPETAQVESLEVDRTQEYRALLAHAMDYDERVVAREVTYARSLAKIEEGSFARYHVMDSCTLAEFFDLGGGIYRVESIVGVTEVDLERSQFPLVSTFIRLSLVEPWTRGTKESLIVRVDGGPLYEDSQLLHFIGLEVGETIGALFNSLYQKHENDGFVAITKPGLFKDYDGTGVTNEQLFVNEGLDLAQVGAILTQTYLMEDCVPLARPRERDWPDENSDRVEESSDEVIELGEGW